MDETIVCIWCGCTAYSSGSMDGICRDCWEANQFALEKQESLERLENMSHHGNAEKE